MIGLHQFETEQIPLGGGRSRGLGVVKLSIDQVWWIDPDGNPDQLITYLQRLVSRNLDDYKLSSETLESYAQDWTEKLIQHLQAQIPATASP